MNFLPLFLYNEFEYNENGNLNSPIKIPLASSNDFKGCQK